MAGPAAEVADRFGYSTASIHRAGEAVVRRVGQFERRGPVRDVGVRGRLVPLTVLAWNGSVTATTWGALPSTNCPAW